MRYLIIVLALFLALSSYGQVTKNINHDYPRTASWTFYNGVTASYVELGLDLVRVSRNDNVQSQISLARNPNTYHLMLIDLGIPNWAPGWGGAANNCPSPIMPQAWFATTPAGVCIHQPDASIAEPNFSISSTTGALYGGKRYIDTCMSYVIGELGHALYDGFVTEGPGGNTFVGELISMGGGLSGIDLDKNGVADINEHGELWIYQQVHSAHKLIADTVKARFFRQRGAYPLIVNQQGYTDTIGIRWNNGRWLENVLMTSVMTIPQWMSSNDFLYYDTAGLGGSPVLAAVNFDLTWDQNNAPAGPTNWERNRNNIDLARWFICVGLLTNRYVSIEMSGDHYINYAALYDENKVKLGYPRSNYMAIPGHTGVYCRFFTRGVVIVNVGSTTQTITASDLAATGSPYGDDQYYKFRGGQDTAWNSGGLFSSVTLATHLASGASNLDGTGSVVRTQHAGDGIILTLTDTTVIADIVVDNNAIETSPGSPGPSFSGFSTYTGNTSDYQRAYKIGASQFSRYQNYMYHYAPAGGAATATYTPTIGKAGWYVVYEHHSWYDLGGTNTEATNTPIRISYAGGYHDITLNQRDAALQGRWNKIDSVYLTPTTPGNVRLSTSTANGRVIADAVRWQYVGTAPGPVEEEPAVSNKKLLLRKGS